MRVLVTALASARQPTGLAVYARRASDRLTAAAPESTRVVSLPNEHGSGSALAAARLRWLVLRLDAAARDAKADAVLHLLPEVGRTTRPQVVVLHDLAPLLSETTWRQRVYFRTVVTHAVRSAAGVVADSEHTRRDAIEILGVVPSRIVVVHPGVDLDRFRPRRDARDADKPFVLAVGSHAPHKRLGLLMRGFAASALTSTHELQVVGPASRFTSALIALRDALGIERCVRFLPYDSLERLALRYASADLYASVSDYEGFGLPALEALASGTPVLVTDVGGASAYVGGAGLMLPRNPGVAEIAVALGHAVQLRAAPQVREQARRQAEAFSWDRTARGLLDAVRAFTSAT